MLLVGILLGYLSSYLAPATEEPRFEHYGNFFYFSWTTDPVIRLHVALTTLQLVLLLSLVAVYLKVYADTRANFSLGLVVVLWALLVEGILSYPLLQGMAGPVPVGPGPFLLFADIFVIVAYTVFLYLSLE